MPETAESLAANVSSRRNLTLELTNNTRSFCLTDPKIYLNSGHVHSPPQPTVRPLRSEVCNFTKTTAKAEGAVGVLTYDLFQRHSSGAKEKIAVMFSVPYDYNLYKNWFALSIIQQDEDCDEKLYKKLYYNKESGFVRQEANGCCLTFEGDNLDLLATMTPMGRSMMKLEVWDKIFSPPKNQSGY